MIEEANLQWRYMDTRTGLILPWYTLPTLQWVVKQDIKEWKVFEYGGGYSSIWWRINVGELHSVDSDLIWSKMSGSLYCGDDKQKYITAVKYLGLNINKKFDCIVVDGLYRDECVEFCIDYLKDGGYLIIDNYEQPSVGDDFTRTNELLKDWNKTVYKQPNHSDWQTAIFQK